jgi:hypothetical protein
MGCLLIPLFALALWVIVELMLALNVPWVEWVFMIPIIVMILGGIFAAFWTSE